MEQISWAVVLGGVAGFVRYIQPFSEPQKPEWSWLSAAIAALTGGFVGYLTLQLIDKQFGSSGYVNVAIAVAGYGGKLTLDAGWQAGKDIAAIWLARAAQKPPDDPPKG